jgi:hypothetical protein
MGSSIPRAIRIVLLCAVTYPAPAFSQSIQCEPPVAFVPPAGTAAPAPGAPAKGQGRIFVEQSALDINVSSATDTVSLSVSNQTLGSIEKLSISSLGFLDGKTGERLPQWPQLPFLLAGGTPLLELGSYQRTDCRITLPPLDHAGSYAGVLRVNGSGYEATAPMTIRTRGPYIRIWNGWFPFCLLTAVFVLGWLVSFGLDHWISVSLPRVQQLEVLSEAQETLASFLAAVAAWETANHVEFTKVTDTAAFDKSALDRLLVNPNLRPLTDLQQAAQRYSLSSALNDEFYTAIEIAKAKIPAEALRQVALELDALPTPADVAGYRAALLQILTAPVNQARVAASAALAAPSKPGADLSHASAASLHRRIVFMDFARLAVTGVVVWITAYTVFYLPNPSFGTLSDYLTLFLWSLGLTTAGSQIVSGIRKT